jgi:ankyrin repeat protein
LLIEHGADVNAQDGHFGNALQAASYTEHIDIVQLLIDHGADANAQSGKYGSALQAASFEGHIDIVQFFIEHGVDVNVGGGKYGSALKAALYRGIDREWQLRMDHENTLIQRLENIAHLLRNNGAHEEDPAALSDYAVPKYHGQQSTNGEYFLWWL